MSTKHAEYVEQAEYCKHMADRAAREEQKAAWLGLASKWLALTEQRAGADRLNAVIQSIDVAPQHSRGTNQ